MEYWVEENIRPNTSGDVDRVLYQHIMPIVFYLELKGWVACWHFLRESTNWRGSGDHQPFVLHIRFRVKTMSETDLTNVRDWLRRALDGLVHVQKIADHYRGNHGTPNQDYSGESINFNENIRNPKGWIAAQKWLQAGSEIELIFLKHQFRGVQLAQRFRLADLFHFPANQFDRDHDWTRGMHFMIIQM